MQTLWAIRLKASPAGLCAAREAGLVLLRDYAGQLTLFAPTGQPLTVRSFSGGLLASCAADDGESFACATTRPHIHWLAADLSTRWERPLSARVTALALTPLGTFLAIADESSHLTVFDAQGQQVWQTSTARPLMHLAWIPESDLLFASADFGLVTLFTNTGQPLWRHGLLSHVGGLSVNGDGQRLLVACFTEGVRRYPLKQPRPVSLRHDLQARQVAQNYTGDVVLSLQLEGTQLLRCDADCQLVTRHALPAPALGLALSLLGDWAVVALSNQLLRVEW